MGIYDDDNFYVCEETIKKTGKHVGDTHEASTTYHHLCEDALMNMADRLAKSQAVDIRDYILRLQEFKNSLGEAVQGVK